jgi:CubicO group peptidase (beta-lactamase class C family)
MYIDANTSDSLMYKILQTPLRPNLDYKYSDLGYYFMREIIQNQSGKRIDQFARENFYQPLGLNTMGYLPLECFPMDRMVPTEYDTYFRNQLIHGDVHDPGAAMQGGVGGHAGVFSNAEDLAVIMQMLLNKGVYGGKRYLEASTIEEYTRCQFCEEETDEARRGAGFDKPVMDEGPGPTCKCVSFKSFGHSGFTGTIAWADPVENIVYVFLSNRVYPSAKNKKLARMDIRTNIQKEIYKVLAPNSLDTLSSANP